MNIDTGEIYDNLTEEKLKELRELADIIELHENDLTETEKEKKHVDLDSNTRAASYARNFRNMRSFVEKKYKNRR